MVATRGPCELYSQNCLISARFQFKRHLSFVYPVQVVFYIISLCIAAKAGLFGQRILLCILVEVNRSEIEATLFTRGEGGSSGEWHSYYAARRQYNGTVAKTKSEVILSCTLPKAWHLPAGFVKHLACASI